MTNEQAAFAFAEAKNYTDPEAFVSDMMLSNQFLPLAIPSLQPDLAKADSLRALWCVANDPFRELLGLMGLSQSECSRLFCIPLRTVQDWATDRHAPPPYIRLLLAQAVGLI